MNRTFSSNTYKLLAVFSTPIDIVTLTYFKFAQWLSKHRRIILEKRNILILLYPYRFNEFHWKLFEIDFFRNNVQIEIWDLSFALFKDFSKMIKRYAAQKMIEGRRPVGVRVSNDKIWNLIAHRDGEISFEINLENPFIKFVLESGDSSKISLMLKKISKELPIVDIISKQERYFIDEKMGNEELNDLKSIYTVLYPEFSEEEINKLLWSTGMIY